MHVLGTQLLRPAKIRRVQTQRRLKPLNVQLLLVDASLMEQLALLKLHVLHIQHKQHANLEELMEHVHLLQHPLDQLQEHANYFLNVQMLQVIRLHVNLNRQHVNGQPPQELLLVHVLFKHVLQLQLEPNVSQFQVLMEPNTLYAKFKALNV